MPFKKANWIDNTDVYEVNLRQYTKEGTIAAFAKELPRLRKMGVSTLWFMPITPIATQNRKGSLGSYYACSDYKAVSEEFGTLAAFKQLVVDAHVMGFKVILDWVANHTGWGHVWTKEHPEYYKIDPATNDFKTASGMDDIIELDYSNPALRAAMIDAMLFWVKECDIDGFRCDLAFWVDLSFWLEARAAIEATKTLFWLAESDPIEHPEYYRAFDSCYSWTWMHKTEEFCKQKADIGLLYQVMNQFDQPPIANELHLWFTSNHDENTWNGTEYEKYGAAALPLAVFSFTRHGIPMIYSGQELPNLKRLEFFDKDTINWTGNNQLEDFYSRLLHLHQEHPALRGGDVSAITIPVHTNVAGQVIAFMRKKEEREVLVLLNMSEIDVACTLKNNQLTGQYRELFTEQLFDLKDESTIELSSWGYWVGVK